jgi:hypothetical protein
MAMLERGLPAFPPGKTESSALGLMPASQQHVERTVRERDAVLRAAFIRLAGAPTRHRAHPSKRRDHEGAGHRLHAGNMTSSLSSL